MYCSFALAGHGGTCLCPLHIFALLLLCFAKTSADIGMREYRSIRTPVKCGLRNAENRERVKCGMLHAEKYCGTTGKMWM